MSDIFNLSKGYSDTKLTEEVLDEILEKVSSEYFYVIQPDLDTPRLDNFSYEYTPCEDEEQYVHIWNKQAGLLMFHTETVKQSPKDFTYDAMVAGKYKFKELHYAENLATVYSLSNSHEDPDVVCLKNDKLSLHGLNVIKRTCKTPYFYVIKNNTSTNIDLARAIDRDTAITFWNGDDSVRLFNSEKVFENIRDYTDDKWWAGEISDVMNISDSSIRVSSDNSTYNNYTLILLTRGWPDWCQKMADTYGEIIHIDSYDLGLRQVHEILDQSQGQYIYVATNYVSNFKFDEFSIPEHDQKYVHTWNNNDVLRLFHRTHLDKHASYCTDKAMVNGITEVKDITDPNITFGELDIIFLSYKEKNADENYKKLKERFPYAKRLDGVKGIFEAHKAAANVASTHMFYVVDADAIIKDDFNFDYYPNIYGRDCVYVWRSQNPCNGLEYGYGGIKLFPTKRVRDANEYRIDFTTSIAKDFKAMEQVSNVTAFNTDAFSAWRSGFREGVKLSSDIIVNSDSKETLERLETWTSVALDVPFAEDCKDGAKEGFLYGRKNILDPAKLNLVNDYTWLEKAYNDRAILV